MEAIEVKDLFVEFGDNPVLKGVNFRVEEGKTTVIAGVSGAGKTILLKAIIGLLQPTRGRGKIFIRGRETTNFSGRDWDSVRKEIGMVFQGNALFDSIPVWENVGFYLLEHTRLTEKEIRKEVSDILGLVGLPGIEDLWPDELSGGMKKRVALARTLIFKPKIILYDEPTAGLDPLTAESIGDLILDLQNKLGTTTLIVTHDRPFTFRVANRIGFLFDGQVIGFGSASEIKESKNESIHEFFYA